MINRKKRLADGSFGPLENISGAETPEEKIKRLENDNLQQMMAVTEVFEQNIKLMEQNAKLQEENTAIMLAMTDLFEQTVTKND